MRKLAFLATLAIVLLVLPPVVSAAEGWATWYGPGFHGRRMANGQVFDQYDPTTTASNQFPLGTWLKVTNPANGRSVYVQVRDRGAFQHALDLSYGAFKAVEDPARMWVWLRYEVVPGPGQPPPTPTPRPAPLPTATPTPAVAPRAELSARSGRPQESAATARQHTVRAGDTLWDIAARYGVDIAALASANRLRESDLLQIGQTLSLPGAAASAPAPAASTGAPLYHVVAEGDALSVIADRYGVSVGQLARANGIEDPNRLALGQRLVVPTGSGGSSGSPGRAARQHVVQVGDNLYDLALRYGVDPDELARLNGLADPDLLQPGQVLRLP